MQSKTTTAVAESEPVAKEIKKETKEKKPTPSPPPVSQKVAKRTIDAVFEFYPSNQNPNLPSGSYSMQGQFDPKTRELSLGGIRWLKRPEGYDMIPLIGKIGPGPNDLTGNIEFQGCETFQLRRKGPSKEFEVSGEWVGQYSCEQGVTGLTLKIQ